MLGRLEQGANECATDSVGRSLMWRLRYTLAAGLCLATLFGCAERASETECDQAYDRLIDVRIGDEPEIVKTIKRGTLEKNRTAFLTECVGRMPKPVLTCWMAAESIEAMEKCETQ